MSCEHRAGDLIDWITIEQYTQSKDAVGTPILSWAELEQVSARVKFLRGDEKETYTKETAITIAEILVSVRTDLDTRLRIVFDSDNYNILAILEEGDLYQKLVCQLVE